jgi:hypothetical protein
MLNNELIDIEKLEHKYLMKYYYFLKFVEDDIINGLETKNEIKDDWFEKWSNTSEASRKSDFSTGAERIIYSLINSRSIGVPNSCPVGSDLMFEVDDAFIHIDLKTVQTSNIGDFATKFTLGNNQVSYKTTYVVNNQERNFCGANLPQFYKKTNNTNKVCLTYFLNILHDANTLQTIMSYITCFPNGLLESQYGGKVLCAGKIVTDVRANLNSLLKFQLLPNAYRTMVLYVNDKIIVSYENKLQLLLDLRKKQNQLG